MSPTRSLADDYTTDFDCIAEFYGPGPVELRTACNPPFVPEWDDAIIDETAEFNRRTGAASADTIPKWRETSPLAVVTGQQTGIFTGPLYTVYKALGAIALARDLADRWDRPVVPVFWVAGDDHDLDEACTVRELRRGGGVETYRYVPSSDSSDMSMWNVPIEEATVTYLIDRFESMSLTGEFREEVVTALKATASASASVADWFVRLMAKLFVSTELVFFDPHGPKARECAARVLKRELMHPAFAAHAANRTGDRLRQLGYDPQVVKSAQDVSCFLDIDGRRTKITTDGTSFLIGNDRNPMTKDDMVSLVETEPERFSPNVLLRPVVQQVLLPTAAYVAGPGEIAYWGQLRGVFEVHDVRMPCVYPRPRAVLATEKQLKNLSNLELRIADVDRPNEDLINQLVRKHAVSEPTSAIENARESILDSIAGLEKDLDRNFARQVSRLRDSLTYGLDKLAATVAKSDEQAVETVRRKVSSLHDALMPDGHPQERRYTILPYISERGWSLIDQLLESIDLSETTIREISM